MSDTNFLLREYFVEKLPILFLFHRHLLNLTESLFCLDQKSLILED